MTSSGASSVATVHFTPIRHHPLGGGHPGCAPIMAHARHASKKKKKRTAAKSRVTVSGDKATSWVDAMVLEPVDDDVDDGSSTDAEPEDGVELPVDGPTLSIVSWNVLAESYCNQRSQHHLPLRYQSAVFSSRRKARIVEILTTCFANMDVLCLQEVDLDEIGRTLRDTGYVGVETPRTTGGGAGGRSDACAMYAKAAVWEWVQDELVRLDDLSTLSSSTESLSVDNNLQGLQQSFLRRNVALLVRLRHKVTGQTVVVANAHLYWHPGYEYVKLCQAHYILVRAKRFCHPDEPFVFCGDLNSRPHGAAHSYLTHGWINAKRIAPWYSHNEEEETMVDDDEDGLVKSFASVRVNESDADPPRVRYILDATLNRFCRWLRILGVDTALETEEEEKLRTGKDKQMILFDRCRREGRTLVTASTRIMLRKGCPAGTYCINPTMLPHLEVALVHLLLAHGVVLEPRTFLTRCVVCNGMIVEVLDVDEKRRILREYQAPEEIFKDDMEVFECDGCRQGYWWCDRPTSSASRVMSQATQLFELCLRGGVPIRGGLNAFEHVDVAAQREMGWDYNLPGSELLKQKLDAIDWLREEKLECPFQLESAYAAKDDNGSIIGETLPFTNVTHDFVNTLDYIYFSSLLAIPDRLRLPKSFRELNPRGLKNGHLLPSDIWPSDHLAIGALFSFETGQSAQAEDDAAVFCVPTNAAASPPPTLAFPLNHGQRCNCGCVPSIPSLFEMAEMRKQARLKRESIG